MSSLDPDWFIIYSPAGNCS